VKSSESRQWWSPSDLRSSLENAFIVWIGSQRESFPRFTSVVWDIGGITLSAQRVLIFVISLVALGLLFYVIARTKLGLGIRAVSQDNDTALLMGVRPNRIYAITFGISAALAGSRESCWPRFCRLSISWVVPVPPLVRCRDGRWARERSGYTAVGDGACDHTERQYYLGLQ